MSKDIYNTGTSGVFNDICTIEFLLNVNKDVKCEYTYYEVKSKATKWFEPILLCKYCSKDHKPNDKKCITKLMYEKQR